MKQGTIKYSQEFISPTGLKRWVTIEHPIDFDSENYLQVYENVASMVSICGAKPPNDLTGMPGQAAPMGEIAVDRGNPKATLEADIKSCMEIKVLESYKFLVRNDSQLQKVYDERFAELK